jgi:hypothetical protein
MVKKIAFALAAIGLSSAAFAGHPGDAVVAPIGVNLIAPDSVGVWSVGLEALYMEPTNSSFQYAQVEDLSAPASTSKNKSVSGDHEWGGTIDVDYMFPGNSRDVKLAYTHLDMDNGSHVNVNSALQALDDPFGISPAIDADSARGHSDYDYDAVDLVFGQWIRVCDRLDLHPFGGLRYASIDMKDKGTYTFTSASETYGVGRVKSDFDGIGPRAGLDAVVHVGSGVSFVGTIGTSLLVGDIDAKFSDSAYVLGVLDAGNSFKNSDDTRIVPEVDARLGINYTYNFDPATAFGVELGYQAVNYFDVADKDYFDALVPNTINNSEDFGYHGPYLRVQLSMA